MEHVSRLTRRCQSWRIKSTSREWQRRESSFGCKDMNSILAVLVGEVGFLLFAKQKINRTIKPIKSPRDIYLLELGRSCHHATLKIIFTTQTQEIVQGKEDVTRNKSSWFSAFIHNSQILDSQC